MFMFITECLFLILMTIISVIIVKEEHIIKINWDYEFIEGDIIWTSKVITNFIISSFLIGLISALAGLGGGVFFNPFMLSYGISPIVASSTGMYMVMFSNFSNCLLYIFSGVLDGPFALWLGLFSVLGAVVGVKLINEYIRRTGKSYYIAFVLAGVVLFSAVVIPVFGVLETLRDLDIGADIFTFDSVC